MFYWEPSPVFLKFTYTTRCSPTKCGDDFMKFWYEAEEGRLEPFVLVVEGSIPNEKIKQEGYWAALANDPAHRPTDYDVRMDRPPCAESAGRRRRRHVRHLRRHSRDEGQSDGLHGSGGLPRLEVEIQGRPTDRECAGLSGAAR